MYKINPSIRWRWEKDKVLLSTFIGMNRIAGEILALYEQVSDPELLVECMLEKYPDVPKENLRNDINKITNQLVTLNVLVPEECGKYPQVLTDPFSMGHMAEYFGNELSAPAGVACEITARCNARCLHCSIPSTTEDENELSTLQWKTILDHLADINVFGVSFTGGEPLVRTDLLDLVEHAHEKGLRVSVATNAFLLNEDMIEKLRAHGVDFFMISLDGATARTHDTFRGLPGLYDKVVHALSVLAEQEIPVGVVTIVTKMNITEIPLIVEVVKDTGVDRISIANMRLAGRAAENMYLEPTVKDLMNFLSILYKKDQETTGIDIKYPNLPAKVYVESIGMDSYRRIVEQGKIGVCGAGIIGCAISPHGDVKPCDMSGPVTLGNVVETPLKDIWKNSAVFCHMRTITVKEQIPCKECTLNEVCLPGCKGQPYQIGEENKFRADRTRDQCFNAFRHDLVKK